MTRSNAREIAVRLVFELGFSESSARELLDRELQRPVFERLGGEDPLYAQFPNAGQRAYITALVTGAADRGEELDGYIAKYSIGWAVRRIPRTARAILRVCLFEILYMGDVPNAAAINEAVELTKKYADPELAPFVNGILGTFVRTEPIPEKTASAPPAGTFDPDEPSAPEGENE